jgi:hypothetical protein
MERQDKLLNIIPQNCIDSFVKKFTMFPSAIKLEGPFNKKVFKYFEKFHLIWFYSELMNNGEIIKTSSFYEYDSSGIMVYIYGDDSIFILTTPDRNNASEFLINNLKRLK